MKEKILFFLILILAFGVRLYRINNPLADWHSWRQADTSAVSRNFLKFGFDILHPRYDDLSNVASGLDNPQGYRFVEFPLFNIFQAGLGKIFPVFTLEVWGRLTSIFFSLVSLVFLYLITKKYSRVMMALLSAFFFAVLPFNIYFSRTILPEPTMVALSLGMIYFFDRWLGEKQMTDNRWKVAGWRNFGLSVIFGALAILVKPYAVFLFLPMLYLWYRKKNFSTNSFIWLFAYLVIGLLPFVLWRLWIAQYPQGIPSFGWLLNSDGIRFKGAFFWWIFAERLGKLILGVWGLPLFVLGILAGQKKEGWFFHWWLVAILAYLTVVATGNVRHDYYQIMTIPIISIFLGKGVEFLITEGRRVFNPVICYLLSVICITFMFSFSWYQVRDYFNVNNSAIIEAGKAVDRLTPKNARVIAPYGGDTAFLYQTNRQGWPVGFEIEKKIAMGADYYVNINVKDPETQYVIKKWKPVVVNDRYVIVKLR